MWTATKQQLDVDHHCDKGGEVFHVKSWTLQNRKASILSRPKFCLLLSFALAVRIATCIRSIFQHLTWHFKSTAG